MVGGLLVFVEEGELPTHILNVTEINVARRHPKDQIRHETHTQNKHDNKKCRPFGSIIDRW